MRLDQVLTLLFSVLDYATKTNDLQTCSTSKQTIDGVCHTVSPLHAVKKSQRLLIQTDFMRVKLTGVFMVRFDDKSKMIEVLPLVPGSLSLRTGAAGLQLFRGLGWRCDFRRSRLYLLV